MNANAAPARKTCTDHAPCCGQHFHGLGAFDAHRRDGVCFDASEVLHGPNSKRSGLPVLQAWSTDGFCKLEQGCFVDGRLDHYVEGVTVWQIATTEEEREKLKEAFNKEPAEQAELAI